MEDGSKQRNMLQTRPRGSSVVAGESRRSGTLRQGATPREQALVQASQMAFLAQIIAKRERRSSKSETEKRELRHSM